MGNLLPKEEYSMAAVIGLECKKIEQICEEISSSGKFVVPANYNCQIQTVISGTLDGIDEAVEKLKELGARKVIKLKTSGPFHTSKLVQAKIAFEKELENVSFNKIGNVQVIKNIDGTIYNQNDNIREILAKHIVSPVRFDKAIELMKREQIEQYIEIGQGKSLTGFIKKENKEANTVNISDVETLKEFLNKV